MTIFPTNSLQKKLMQLIPNIWSCLLLVIVRFRVSTTSESKKKEFQNQGWYIWEKYEKMNVISLTSSGAGSKKTNEFLFSHSFTSSPIWNSSSLFRCGFIASLAGILWPGTPPLWMHLIGMGLTQTTEFTCTLWQPLSPRGRYSWLLASGLA